MAKGIGNVAQSYMRIDNERNGHCEVIVNEETGKKCGIIIKTARLFNFNRHLQRYHVEFYREQQKKNSADESKRAAKTPRKTPFDIAAENGRKKSAVSRNASPAIVLDMDTMSEPSTSFSTPAQTSSQNDQHEDCTASAKKRSKTCVKRKCLGEYLEKSRVIVHISMATLLEAIIEMVTLNGRPFSIVKDSGFRKILDPLLKAFPGNPVINPEKLSFLIQGEADKVKTEIRSLFSNRMFSIKIDAVTRLEKGYLGINAQTIEGGKILIRCLGCVFLEKKHTSQYIKRKIMEVLEAFGFKLTQVYSITYDNGRNMVKAGQILSDEAADVLMQLITGDNVAYNESSNINEEEEGGVENVAELAEDKEYENTLKEALESMATLCALCEENIQMGIDDLRCVAHTLQLVVDGVLKKLSDPEFNEEISLIDKARSMIKYLRTQTMRREIERFKRHNPDVKLKLPVIDMPTRWMSTHDMLQSCIDCKVFCKSEEFFDSEPPVLLSESEFEEVELLLKSLKPLKIATLKFQEEQLTIPCMALAWQRAKLELRSQVINFSEMLYAEMVIREKTIFSQMAVICALYLDPRTYMLVPINEVKKVQERLLFLGNRIQSLKFKEGINDSNSNDLENINLSTDEENNEDDLLEKEMQRLEKGRRQRGAGIQGNCLDLSSIESEIKSFEVPPKLKSKDSILEFWEKNKYSLPALYELSQVVLGAPATQVSVERLFSGLKFIMNPLRNGMKPETVDNIMIVRTNKIFFSKTCL